jgi:hypothetical protein
MNTDGITAEVIGGGTKLGVAVTTVINTSSDYSAVYSSILLGSPEHDEFLWEPA